MSNFQSEKAIEARKEMAQVLDKVLHRELSTKSALEIYYVKLSSIDKSVDCALHALLHYRDDEDIRMRDKKYGELQENDLRSMAVNLARGSPITKDHISFYTPRFFDLKVVFDGLKKMLRRK